jgi:Zn-dependent protease
MKMEKNALLLGSILGIPIRLHISLLIMIGILSIFSGLNLLSILILAVGIFGSIALHELGHALVARAKGGYIHEIILYPFGGAAKISKLPTRPIDEIMVAMAGPLVSLALFVLFKSFEITYFLGHLNGILFLFNILPVFPMDGGRVLRAGLAIKKSRLEATRVAAQIGKYFCGLFIIIGLFGMPFRLLGLIGPFEHNFMLMFIGFYIYGAGQQELRMVMMEHQEQPHANRYKHNAEWEVEVSPPPYAHGNGNSSESIFERLKKIFKN